MPLFLGKHKFPADADIEAGWAKYKQSATEMGLKPLKALISKEAGQAYCQTEADTKEQVEEAHNKAEVPFEEIIEVESLD